MFNRRCRFSVGLLILAVAMVLMGCAAEPTATPAPPAPTAPPPQPTEEPPADVPLAETPWLADGIVGDGEYPHTTTIGQVSLAWWNDAEFLYMAMWAETTGWVAVGLDPENRMQGANYVFGFIQDGEAQVQDGYGTAPVGPNHPGDVEEGGTDDLVAFGGSEADGVTTIEFKIPLDSGDAYDKALEPGETYDVIVATAPQDDYDLRHTYRGGGTITLD